MEETNGRTKLTNVQLQQKIIHLQSELSRYKELVVKYQTNYHYKQMDELNTKLITLNEQLQEKEAEIANANKAKAEIEKHVQQMIDERTSEKEHLITLQNENDELKKQVEALTEKISASEKVLVEKEEEVKKLRDMLSGKPTSTYIASKKRINVENDESEDSWFFRTLKQQQKKDK